MRDDSKATMLGMAAILAALWVVLTCAGPALGGFTRDVGEAKVQPTSCGGLGSASDGRLGCPTPVGTPQKANSGTGSAGTDAAGARSLQDHRHPRMLSTEAGYLEDGGTTALTCGSSNQGKAQVLDDGRIQYCDGAGTSVVRSLPLVLFTQTANATVSNTSTETTVLGSGVGSLTLPTGLLNRAGSTLRVRVGGTFSTKATSAGNLTVRVKIGGTTVISRAGGLTDNVTASDAYFEAVATITTRTTGATGTTMAYGAVRLDTGAFQIGPSEWNMQGTAQPVTVDLTGTPALDVTAQFQTADASNTVTIRVATVEVLN